MASAKSWWWDAALLLVASPVYAVVAGARLLRQAKLVRIMVQRAMRCRTCDDEVSLIGFWRCGCGFTYRGHLLQLCPICGTLPQLIRCEHCGTLLARAALIVGEIEIKCRRCGRRTLVRSAANEAA